MSARAISLALFALAALPAQAAPSEPRAVRSIELYATTDIHGHLVSHTRRGKDGRAIEVGGLALLGGYLKNARAHAPGRVLLLDGGDMMQGTLASNLSEGAAMIRGLNQLGYAAVALGNHEFDYGPVGPQPAPMAATDDPRGALRARMHEARFPILSANVEGPDHLFAPYVLRDVDGVKVAIVGATTTGLPTTTLAANVADLVVRPLLPAVLNALDEARAKGARVFFVVAHAGGECDRPLRSFTSGEPDDLTGCHDREEGFELVRGLAEAARNGHPRVSAVVGGHTHQPVTAVIGGVPFMQAGKNGEWLVHASIEIDGRGPTAHATGRYTIDRPLPVCPRIDAAGACGTADEASTHAPDHFGPVVPDPTIEAAIATDLETARQAALRLIGIVLPDGLRASYGDESALGNLAADALRTAAKADVGIINGGGLRADLPAGPLTYGALYEAFPFDNQVVVVGLTGEQVRRTVVHNLHSQFGFLSYSGLKVAARCEASRVLVDVTLQDGTPLDPKKRYRVAAPDFLARGGDEAVTGPFDVGPPLMLVRTALEAALRGHGGTLHEREASLFDPLRPRVRLPSARPVRCGQLEAHEEPTRKEHP